MYMDAYEAVTGKPATGFVFVAVEKKAPYGVSTLPASAAFIELGRQEYRAALKTYAESLRTNHWPKYPDTLIPLELPAFALKQLNDGVYA